MTGMIELSLVFAGGGGEFSTFWSGFEQELKIYPKARHPATKTTSSHQRRAGIEIAELFVRRVINLFARCLNRLEMRFRNRHFSKSQMAFYALVQTRLTK